MSYLKQKLPAIIHISKVALGQMEWIQIKFKSNMPTRPLLLIDKTDFKINLNGKQIWGLIVVNVLTFAVRHYYGIWAKWQPCKTFANIFVKTCLLHAAATLIVHALVGIEVDISKYAFNAMYNISILSHKNCQKHFSKMSDLSYVTLDDFDKNTCNLEIYCLGLGILSD